MLRVHAVQDLCFRGRTTDAKSSPGRARTRARVGRLFGILQRSGRQAAEGMSTARALEHTDQAQGAQGNASGRERRMQAEGWREQAAACFYPAAARRQLPAGSSST